MWQPIDEVPVNTWVLARIREPNHVFIPAVVKFGTRVDRWIDPSDLEHPSGELHGEFHFEREWLPTEWHPLPEENEVVEPTELADDEP